jgi:hypothetical protein
MQFPDRHFAAKKQVEIVIGADRIMRINVDGECAIRIILGNSHSDVSDCRIDVRNDLGEFAHVFANEDRLSELIEALTKIDSWSRAYPLAVFPEPDLKKARELLEAGGITLDAVSASMARHVVEGVGKIARGALKEEPS